MRSYFGDTTLENIADAIREYLDVVDELGAEGERREVTVMRWRDGNRWH